MRNRERHDRLDRHAARPASARGHQKTLHNRPSLVSHIDDLKKPTRARAVPHDRAATLERAPTPMAKSTILNALVSDVAKKVAKTVAIALVSALVGFLASKGWISAQAATTLTNDITGVIVNVFTLGQGS